MSLINYSTNPPTITDNQPTQLPKYKTDDKANLFIQTQWAKSLNPIISLPMSSQNTLQQVKLASGANTINHYLGRPLQGWFVVRQRASATLYDTQDTNTNTEQTLQLTASADVTVDLVVF